MKTCNICRVVTNDKVYCEKCLPIVTSIMLDPANFVLVLNKLRICKISKTRLQKFATKYLGNKNEST